MQAYKTKFIDLAIQHNVLKFGEFTLKSGRVSPYFFNAGLFNTGSALAVMGQCYAQAIVNSGLSYDMLFGPAYKGIPVVTSVATALFTHHEIDKPYAFNRKEVKDHGEGGLIVGSPLKGEVLIVDDVITAGTAIQEAIHIITTQGAIASSVVIALDRQEKGDDKGSAIAELQEKFAIKVISIIELSDLIEYLKNSAELTSHLSLLSDYREQYGV